MQLSRGARRRFARLNGSTVRHLAIDGSAGRRTSLANESPIGVNGDRAIQRAAIENQHATRVDRRALRDGERVRTEIELASIQNERSDLGIVAQPDSLGAGWNHRPLTQ